MRNKFLILGDGLLGKEICNQTGWSLYSRQKDGFDITNEECFDKLSKIKCNTIINCIAHTDTYSEYKETHWNVNYKGVADLVDFCNQQKIKLVHISTDYIYSNSTPNATEEDVPVHCDNWYGYTKLLGDAHIQLKSNDYLLIRETHKPTPFPYEKAWKEQVGNFDYVDVMGKLIISLIKKRATGIYNVGTPPKTMFELAQRTKSSVKPMGKSELKHPSNLIISTEKMTEFLK